MHSNRASAACAPILPNRKGRIAETRQNGCILVEIHRHFPPIVGLRHRKEPRERRGSQRSRSSFRACSCSAQCAHSRQKKTAARFTSARGGPSEPAAGLISGPRGIVDGLMMVNFLACGVAQLFQFAVKPRLRDLACEKILLGRGAASSLRGTLWQIFALARVGVVHVKTHLPDRDIDLDWPPLAVLKHGIAVERHQKSVGSFTSFPPSRRVRFPPRTDIRPRLVFMSKCSKGYPGRGGYSRPT